MDEVTNEADITKAKEEAALKVEAVKMQEEFNNPPARVWPYPRKKKLDKGDKRRIARAVLRRVKKWTKNLEMKRRGAFAEPTVTPFPKKA